MRPRQVPGKKSALMAPGHVFMLSASLGTYSRNIGPPAQYMGFVPQPPTPGERPSGRMNMRTGWGKTLKSIPQNERKKGL